jgi:hypothetical protein
LLEFILTFVVYSFRIHIKFWFPGTGERIASEYCKLIREYKLEDKILRAKTDSGSNVKKAHTQDIFVKKIPSDAAFRSLLSSADNGDVREHDDDSFRLLMAFLFT